MSFLPEIRDINNYNAIESKLIASVRWLISRVFDKEIPDMLREVLTRDQQGHSHLSVTVRTALTNGSLYSQACARIFKDASLMQHRPEALLQLLAQSGHPAAFKDGSGRGVQSVTEDLLCSVEPFEQMAHMSLIDVLMALHVRTTCTIERAIDAVGRYTSVEDAERPMDATDALLFWINKVCLLVRDDVERTGMQLKGGGPNGLGGVIPEMEDLYEDICDGCCLCALISFYFPQRIDLREICFNERPSMTDCQYNLLLIQRFCDSMPCNPWHFSTEDILYMHESMQVNVNAFLADLFDFFEPLRHEVPDQAAAVTASTSSPRRFVPIQGIPDLRAANSAARPTHPPKTRFGPGSLTGPRPPRSMSVMSADSLAGSRPSLPLSARLQQEQQWGGNVTAFGQLPHQVTEMSNGMATFAAPGSSPVHSNSNTYSRSDSLPAASIRLALEEKRREHERKKALASTMTEAERAEKSKAAFFALMSKHAKNTEETSPSQGNYETHDIVDTLSRQVLDLQAKVEQMTMEREGERMARATSQPSIYHESSAPPTSRPFSQSGGAAQMAVAGGQYAQPYTGSNTQNEYFYAGMQPQQYSQYEQPQFHAMRPSLSNGVLNYIPPCSTQQQFDAYGQQHMQQPQGYYTMQPNAYGNNEGYGRMGPMGGTQQQYGMPSVMHQSAHASLSSHPQPPPRPPSTGPLQQMPTSTSFSSQIAPPPQYEEALQQLQQQQQQQQGSVDGFRLHQGSPAAASRLDPPLELNRNLTNWGLTYRQGSAQRTARRTWENETFVKSEQDLVNQPENVPSAEGDQQAAPVSMLGRSSRSREETPASVSSTVSSRHGGSESEGPPRDPTSRGKENKEDGRGEAKEDERTAGERGPAGAFVVGEEAAAQDFDNISEQRRQAKREALLAKTQKRMEEMNHKLDTVEAKNAEKRQAEMEKQALADQRKIEKEIQRQKILDEYKRRKLEKEMGMESSRSVGRGSSQPPFARTKSQGLTDTPRGTTPRARGQSNLDEGRKITVASCAEPTLKLFAKAVPKSNRNLIMNALQFSVYPGAVSADARNKVLAELAKSSSKHILLLFRDHKCQYRGIYEWDQVSESCNRIHGTGPKIVSESMMQMMFKYETGTKVFNHIPTKHLSATIDGFTIKDEYWQKSKVPHSGQSSAAPSHRDN